MDMDEPIVSIGSSVFANNASNATANVRSGDTVVSLGHNRADGDNIIPGSRTKLRAAIIESNARTDTQNIFVGRNDYTLCA
jgi:hypothetical protein